ncbi:MAG: holo-[acyl-carrier-protein] synthase [Deltaproteobacteria bacterium]|nr:MAG: holo-[acyl-carrier-protein] synthase [Deltaproteobacteria bacterium]
MVLGLGIDIEETGRIERLLTVPGRGERARSRLFTEGEIAYCEARRNRWQHYAARFAAKEAFAKAIGTGIWQEGVQWTEIEIENDETGRPHLRLTGNARKKMEALGATEVLVSLSHCPEYAVATVIVSR